MNETKPTITLAPLRDGDWPLVAPFLREFYRLFSYRFSARVQGRAFRELLANERLGTAFLICANATPVGYVVLTRGWGIEHGGPVALVDELFVVREFQNIGVGRRALQLVRQFARKQGIRRLFLEVESYNPRAKALYVRLGYRDTRRTLMRTDTR